MSPTGRHPALDVFSAALRLGLTSFGGPVAHIGYFRREYVTRRAWLDEVEFADLVALCQVLPGAASSQLGFAIGTRRAGLAGGLAAWAGFTLPSAAMMVALGLVASSADLSGAGWVHGLKLAAVAVVAQAVVQMARRLTPDWPRRAMAAVAAAAALLVVSPLSQAAIIAAGALAGLLLLRAEEPLPRGESQDIVSPRVGAAALAAFFGLLVLLPLLRPVGGQTIALFDSFYRSGALVFGGGHVVLPLLHANVVDPGWVSDGTFLAGYGAAQALPGPLFTFAAFLGTVSIPAPNGVAGGLIALAAIFLGPILLVLGALPFWGRIRAAARFRRALLGINAAVVGILAAALYTPIWTGAVNSPADVAVAVAGFALLMTGRVPPIAVVAASAAAGQALAML